MKKFELWLDESGDFNNDLRKVNVGANPSLIGGLLIESNTFPDSFVNSVLPEAGAYHSVDENDQLDRFKLINEKLYKNMNNRIVVFSNQECIMILDNNLTYLNIISEGIIQLIKHLKAQHGNIFLKVLIANRVDTTTGLRPENSVVALDEYLKRLKEKILVSGLSAAISDKEWDLQTASARKDKRLMLADIICNTFFTRYKKAKFDDKERSYIEEIYNNKNKTVIFTVFESLLEKKFKNQLIENRIGEAVASVCISNDEELLKRCFLLLKENFNSRGIHDITFQYKFIGAYIEYYINVVRDFDLCLVLLNNLLSYYIPILREYDLAYSEKYSKKLTLDIKFYMLTVYTHLGDIVRTRIIENECDRDMRELPLSLETINYSIKYGVRKVNGLINTFDYSSALAKADEQVDKCREVKELLGLVTDAKRTYYEELGKALGTRLQIKTFMLRFDKALYESAVADSKEAVENFPSFEDQKRQYLYRTQLETEFGKYDEALTFLRLAIGVKEDAAIKDIWKEAERQSPFAVSSYIRIMSEGTMNNWDCAEEMFVPINQENYIDQLYGKDRFFHPDEIILWKYASYCSANGMISAAIKNYERAVAVCFSSDDLTLNVIGMAIEFEYHACLLNNKRSESVSHLKSMQKKWNRIKNIDVQNMLKKVFDDIDFQSRETEYFVNASRKVTF